jgi:hypothetical protein
VKCKIVVLDEVYAGVGKIRFTVEYAEHRVYSCIIIIIYLLFYYLFVLFVIIIVIISYPYLWFIYFSYCNIHNLHVFFHTNNCKPYFSHPCILFRFNIILNVT